MVWAEKVELLIPVATYAKVERAAKWKAKTLDGSISRRTKGVGVQKALRLVRALRVITKRPIAMEWLFDASTPGLPLPSGGLAPNSEWSDFELEVQQTLEEERQKKRPRQAGPLGPRGQRTTRG